LTDRLGLERWLQHTHRVAARHKKTYTRIGTGDIRWSAVARIGTGGVGARIGADGEG